jgi:hypothetical protein
MNPSQLEKQINEIRDKVIENVDKHFNAYISEDLQEINDDEYYLIDSESWSIYWAERLGELKPLMDTILIEMQSDADKSRISDLWNDCISLKRVIDSNIVKYEIESKKEEIVNQYEVFNFLGFKTDLPKKVDPILFAIQEEKLEELHKGLCNQFGYIDISFEEFLEHTNSSDKVSKKIRWKSNDQDLAMLVILMEHFYILGRIYTRRGYQISLIINHFLNKDNLPFNPSSIKTLLRRMSKQMDYELYSELREFISHL